MENIDIKSLIEDYTINDVVFRKKRLDSQNDYSQCQMLLGLFDKIIAINKWLQ